MTELQEAAQQQKKQLNQLLFMTWFLIKLATSEPGE